MFIKFEQVKYYIGERLLLDIPDLVIPARGRIGIVGKNGSGKTTLLKLIEGVLPVEEGSINYQGEVAVIDQFISASDTKSGGEQTKEKIRQSVRQDASIILADEPTNHLDLEGRKYLMKALKQYNGTLLMVSHDRDFLNKMCEEIIEISEGKVTRYPGNYDNYLGQKEIEEKEQGRKYDAYTKERARLSKSINDLHDKSAGIRKAPKRMGNSEARLHTRGKGTLAQGTISKQAETMETRLNQLEVVEKPWKQKELVIPFSEGQQIHKQLVIESDRFNLSAGEKVLLKEAQLQIKTGKRTALIGKNGSGKTTLLQAILAKDSQLVISQKAKFAYFSQSFNQLEEDKSLLENVQSTSIHDQQVARDLLAHLLFRGNSVTKPVKVLSGGERTKVAIAKMILGESNVLILDEPTNHLDIDSLEVLEESLKAYQGTIILVSHDPYFVKHVAEEVIEIKGKQLINAKDKPKQKKRDTKKEDKWVLEMRKTTILSQLSFSLTEDEKLKLEQELSEIGRRLREM
ncbi:ABC-F family ATP-binding cassette domain-containing protein [Vagococcus sp. DIV0080]|uniref:ABC-F family ATP-binding cassette domain-containing protein n=1 Tax=Candidatus Vagococcus giribetii TaxID=2230876 RepID=A0ABS3HR14_9ENTE|nr:ABC-F family ATP-binding cassette domain-containing protein [Vagococcus sp. DIV0080]MBO0476199.1 ABC-F family ATP-binding cassette domain-containing protein [Vagococcus sp. DIV0080]